jgi:hypothetical protein
MMQTLSLQTDVSDSEKSGVCIQCTVYGPSGPERKEALSLPCGSVQNIARILGDNTTFYEKLMALRERGAIPDEESLDFMLSLYETWERRQQSPRTARGAMPFPFGEDNETSLLIDFGCLVIAGGNGTAITRIVTFFKALLNQIFGFIFQIMPPFLTVIPEVDILITDTGFLFTRSLFGIKAMGPIYFTVLGGFVGLHWRLLDRPAQFFVGLTPVVLSIGVSQDPEGNVTSPALPMDTL